MSDVERHYSELLAKHYTWMFGPSFEAKVAEQKQILEDALDSDVRRGLAVDLGAGPGFQTIALAEIGFSPVVAMDTSAELLEELQTHTKDLDARVIHGDILRVGDFVGAGKELGMAEVMVCMGDTITHLESKDAVLRLLRSVNDALVEGGRFVVSYRDLGVEATGVDRFIPVYSDDERVMTCFLEFDGPETVMVHDLVYRRDDGRWMLEKSSYPKLRLAEDWLVAAMKDAGFAVERGRAGRLIRLVCRKAG